MTQEGAGNLTTKKKRSIFSCSFDYSRTHRTRQESVPSTTIRPRCAVRPTDNLSRFRYDSSSPVPSQCAHLLPRADSSTLTFTKELPKRVEGPFSSERLSSFLCRSEVSTSCDRLSHERGHLKTYLKYCSDTVTVVHGRYPVVPLDGSRVLLKPHTPGGRNHGRDH